MAISEYNQIHVEFGGDSRKRRGVTGRKALECSYSLSQGITPLRRNRQAPIAVVEEICSSKVENS